MPSTVVPLRTNLARVERARVEGPTWPAAAADEPVPHRSPAHLIHDMRTPLASIRGQAELLRDRVAHGGTDWTVLAEGLQDIEDAATELGHLVYELADSRQPEPAASAAPRRTPQPVTRGTRAVRPPHSSEPLSQREFDVLRLVARGRSNKRIARDLTIAENTVKTHVSSILGKLGVESRTQAALYAGRYGLISADEPAAVDPFAA